MVTDILHLHQQKLTAYKGNYDTFERTREEQIKNQQKALEANERSRAHMQVFISNQQYIDIYAFTSLSVSLFYVTLYLYGNLALRN